MAKPGRIHNVEDYRGLAHKRLPRAVIDFIEGGAEDEITISRNRESFESIHIIPRILTDVSFLFFLELGRYSCGFIWG